MAFFNSAITVLQTLVVALGAGLGIWGRLRQRQSRRECLCMIKKQSTKQ